MIYKVYMPQKLSTEEFINKAIIVHGNKYDYSKSVYLSTKSKIIIICNIHGEFLQSPNDHLNNNGCRKCGYIKVSKDLSSNLNYFINKANKIHNNKYIYSESIYISSKVKIKIICQEHGGWLANPSDHLLGSGCPKCSNIQQGEKSRNTIEEFINKANKIHNNKYNYDNSNYISMNSKIKIICNIHGEFEITPNSHIFQKTGCPTCGLLNRRKLMASSKEEFVTLANKIHNNKYNYENSIYINANKKIIITCPQHGDFLQRPSCHTYHKHGCPSCKTNISKPEIKWLNYLNISNENRHKTIKINNKIYHVDAFDPKTNTIYEFYGDYWHGNPDKFSFLDINKKNKKTFGELYQKTLTREAFLKNAGYTIVSIWENDFKEICKQR